jgi:hypothetical protein
MAAVKAIAQYFLKNMQQAVTNDKMGCSWESNMTLPARF